jgi:L-aspartate oxidase
LRDTVKKSLRSAAAHPAGPVAGPANDGLSEEVVREIQELMWKDVGIIRTAVGLKRAILRLDEIAARVSHPQTRQAHQAQNLHLAGFLVARSALKREESRGAHYRTDFPDHDDTRFRKHSILQASSIRFA